MYNNEPAIFWGAPYGLRNAHRRANKTGSVPLLPRDALVEVMDLVTAGLSSWQSLGTPVEGTGLGWTLVAGSAGGFPGNFWELRFGRFAYG